MSEQRKTVYVPGSSAKEVSSNFGKILNVSFKVEELIKFAKANANEKGYLNLSVLPRKEESQYGDTHSVKLNDWKPNEGGQKSSGGTKPAATKSKAKPDPFADGGGDTTADDDDIPF